MKRRFVLPSFIELSILGTLAVVCAAVLTALPEGGGLVIVAFPLLLVAMIMGAKRSGQLDVAPQPVTAPVEQAKQSA